MDKIRQIVKNVEKPSIKRYTKSLYRTYTVDGGFMVAATAVRESIPKYFPNELDLPLPSDHKTWYTERLCPPLLAQALRRERLAMFIAQLHYWLQKEDVGVYKHGFHWIYNTEWEWCEQFPWMSEHTIGRVRRTLERLGYVVSNDFNRNPLDRTKYSTLDYYLIAVETGWNPLGLDLNRSYPHPPEFTKGKRQRGRHKSDETPRVYLPIDSDEPDSLKPPKIVDSAEVQNASCNTVTMHSALLPLSSIYKEIPNISKSNLETDLKIEQTEASQGVGSSQIFASENDTRASDGQEEVNSQVTESSSFDQCSAAASLINDEGIESTQQFLASLNTAAQRAECERTLASDQIRRVCIPGLDEETHEILWKHQAQLEKLNADLNAERIKSAIADNPQHLEDAIEAFFENSAKGVKTKEAATGFLFNALRHGWKPRQSSSSASASVQVYTPSQMLADPLPPTLEQLVERKRAAWRNASILRPSIEAWVQQTPGVIMTPLGPALADATNAPLEPDLDLNEAEHLGTPSERDFTPPEENASSSHSNPDTSLAVVQPNQHSLVNYPTPPNNSPNPVPSLPPSSDRALGVDEDLKPMNLTSPEKPTLVDSSATSKPPTEPPIIRRNPCIESNQLWYADRIKKPKEPSKSPFYVNQRVTYEGIEYLVAVPGNPHTQLEGLAKAVANFWLTPVEEVHLTHEDI